MPRWGWFGVRIVWMLALLFSGPGNARAYGESVEIHNRNSGSPLPLLRLSSRTLVDGPVARTRITYVAENKNERAIEAVVNLHVPENTVLTGFGYYYGDRFIPGEMYDKDEAWKIYTAVTSRGRDPGIMDRPTAQQYHAQIFPVAPKRDLVVIIELTHLLKMDRAGAHLELPLTQGNTSRAMDVEAEVRVRRHRAADLTDNFTPQDTGEGAAVRPVADRGRQDEETVTREDTQDGAKLVLKRCYAPRENGKITIRRETRGLAASLYARMVRPGEGYYALTVSAPRELENPRLVLRSRPGTSHSMPTRFADAEAYDGLHVVGRYRRSQRLYVTLLSDNAAPLHFHADLTGERVEDARANPAAALWADKRIAALSDATRRDFRRDIIRLSQKHMVVSPFTALLAIPREELDYYRKVLAKRKIETNTQWTGGGGGDPYIAVRAPADARRVVAVFPTGEVKELAFNPVKGAWTGRFDIPFGTPAGEYQVSVIVVHADGRRTPFVLVYRNLLSAPTLAGDALKTLTARRGQPFTVSVSGTGIRRAVAVAPWGERVDLNGKTGAWTGTLTPPTAWKAGETRVTLVLLDGAHNRTEVTLDVDVQ